MLEIINDENNEIVCLYDAAEFLVASAVPAGNWRVTALVVEASTLVTTGMEVTAEWTGTRMVIKENPTGERVSGTRTYIVDRPWTIEVREGGVADLGVLSFHVHSPVVRFTTVSGGLIAVVPSAELDSLASGGSTGVEWIPDAGPVRYSFSEECRRSAWLDLPWYQAVVEGEQR